MKKVSVVIPMYYEEEVANECYTRMKKVLGDLKNYEHELIFVNDGSKDKTLPILEEIAKKDNNVKVISFCNSNNGCRFTRPTRINSRNVKIVGRWK